jgi:DNA-binding XRE family transcriptional regulator
VDEPAEEVEDGVHAGGAASCHICAPGGCYPARIARGNDDSARRADLLEGLLERIGANVVARRKKLGLTQERLAALADLDLRFVQRVERARTNLSVAVLVGLADALEIAVETLLRPAVLPPAVVGRPPKQQRRRRS